MNINLSNYETTLSDRDFELLEKLKQFKYSGKDALSFVLEDL